MNTPYLNAGDSPAGFSDISQIAGSHASFVALSGNTVSGLLSTNTLQAESGNTIIAASGLSQTGTTRNHLTYLSVGTGNSVFGGSPAQFHVGTSVNYVTFETSVVGATFDQYYYLSTATANWGLWRFSYRKDGAAYLAAPDDDGVEAAAQQFIRFERSANSTVRVQVPSATFNLLTSNAPSVGTASGTTGDIAWDTSFVYVCTSTNSWSRATLTPF